MPASAPPAADSKKPATAPPAKAPAPQEKKTPAAGAAASQQRFDRMAVRAKLAVSEPGDAVEREADAIADKVMRAPAPAPAAKGEAKGAAPAPTPAPAKPAAAGSGAGGAGKVQRQAANPGGKPSTSETPGNAP